MPTLYFCSNKELVNLFKFKFAGHPSLLLLRIMKKNLLASAFAVVALAASAQVSEVVTVKGEGFGFIPKNLTTTGVITPYSTIGIEYNWDALPPTVGFTVYDASSFNVEKSFTYSPEVFYINYTPMKALADFTTKEVINKGSEEDYWGQVNGVYGEDGFETPITTMDEFKAAVAKIMGNDKVEFFTDYSGKFAFHYDDWQEFNGWANQDVPEVRECYFYYNPADNKLHLVTNQLVTAEIDTSNLTWVKNDNDKSSESVVGEKICHVKMYDYDTNCNESSNPYLTQNVFNNDDKYEFLVKTYKQVPAPASSLYESTEGIKNGKFILCKDAQDKYYESYLVVKNEDGKELITIPNASYNDIFCVYRANGKTYIENSEYLRNGKNIQYVIYQLDKTDTGITELARTQVVKSAKTFNMAGMLVGKNAKGLVIQQGGKKYFNK